MQRYNAAFLALGMLASGMLLVFSLTGLISAIRPRPVVPVSMPSPVPTSSPEPITSAHVPILMYHHLKEHPAGADEEYLQLVVTPQAFRQQMDYLRDHGYHTITFADLVSAFNGSTSLPTQPVIITFDDGWEDCYDVAYPILRDRDMHATFFISTNWIENLDGVLSWSQIEEMAANGMEFGSHSVTHPYLTTSEPRLLKFELQESKSALEAHTRVPVTALAYPFGLYDDTVMAAVREAGYLAACTIDPGTLAKAGELLTLPRLWVYGWTDLEDFALLLQPSSQNAK